MINKKAKLFWKFNELPKKISYLSMDDSLEYYTFLKKCHQDGFRQIIITSEIMIKLIEHFVLEAKYTIYSIEFVEEDETLNDDISALLALVATDTAYLSKLLEQLHFLSEKSSIDIKRIYFKGRNTEKQAVNFFIQSNGILGIDENSFLQICEKVSNLIERYLF